MKIHSNNVVSGYFQPKIGKLGTEFVKHKMPSRSFHLAWEDLPAGTVSLALIFIDYDAVPVCGFPWIHWTVANIDPAVKALPENASVEMDLLQGVNSWASGLLPESGKLSRQDASAYGGCAPPDKPHRYTVELYALNTHLKLQPGFYLNELIKAMEGHTLDKAVMQVWYKDK